MLAFIFDTETTGLISNATMKLDKRPRVVDLYCAKVDLKKGKILDEIDLLFNPGIKMPEEAFKTHKISDDMVKDKPPFGFASTRIRQILDKCQCVIAHNARYDTEMLDFEFERLKEPAIKWPLKICTVEQTVQLFGYRLSLSDLYKYLFNEEFKDAHRAKTDTTALIRISIELFKRGII